MIAAHNVQFNSSRISASCNGRKLSTLTVMNVTRQDGGEYYCEVLISAEQNHSVISEKDILHIYGK